MAVDPAADCGPDASIDTTSSTLRYYPKCRKAR